MLTLGIETSCDETSVAVVRDGTQVLSNVISSSKKSFERLAGVIPEEAARQQVACMTPVLDAALKEARCTWRDISLIAVTKGPGLLGSLLVGTTSARVLGATWGIPVIGVHHTLGHLSSPWLVPAGQPEAGIRFPVLTLSASGGHTDLWHRTSHLEGRLIARTRDDAAGEAFDKGASMLGLPYPGGPSIAAAAEHGDIHLYDFPMPLHEDATLDFSFSGLKTSLKYLLRDRSDARDDTRNVAASYEHALCLHLCDRLGRALRTHQDIREVHLVGGVSANLHLRTLAADVCRDRRVTLRHPSAIAYCTDNAAMIAAAGFFLRLEQPDAVDAAFRTVAALPLNDTLSQK
ncbi:MAG: tRNA (adenosine(37)-N6)-threonylcarbamoyltransferase complex transferase subunit TsaD [Candidatus Peribacteraceae bacterium]|nr:tRNA (adenosine(37)-N6)-threonylcarbamoyltransferase complex transferase subunit TsaD [Candidatus Peribacteraceae bacterium]